MKKTFFPFIYTVIISISMFFALSCNKDENGDKIQLLNKITGDDGWCTEVEYDDQNRITQMYDYDDELTITSKFTYNDDDLVKIVIVYFPNDNNDNSTYEFTKRENQITIKETFDYGRVYTSTLDLNSDGLPIRYKNSSSFVENFQYIGENQTEYSSSSETSSVAKYDTKKSMFYHCKTPKWYLLWKLRELGSQNNVTDITYDHGGKTGFSYIKKLYAYIYDNAGFPKKITITYKYEDREDKVEVYECTYITK